jgi:phosphomannomutase
MTDINSSLFRAYDIRGIVDEALTDDAAYKIGRAFASYVQTHAKTHAPTICLAYDGRHSSPKLHAIMTKAFIESGADVLDLGCGPTPMLYYATHTLQAAGGLMITGSHNAPQYNGFKMMCQHTTLFGEAIENLQTLANDQSKWISGNGKVQSHNIHSSYLSSLTRAFNVASTHYLPAIAWDPGNGAAGDILRQLLIMLPGRHLLINGAIDGDFPAHHPDPTKPENLQQLIDIVKRDHYDFGVALDGDGDRIGVVDQHGNILWGDQLLYLFAKDALTQNASATFIADVKTSQAFFNEISKHGANAMMWKTGHSLIKAKMEATNALIAGEMSGHIFFKEHYGIDDALYAGVKLFDLVARKGQPLASLLKEYPRMYATPEIRINCADEKKPMILSAISKALASSKAEIITTDGLRVHTDEGWWLLRASNTEPVLVARVEAYKADSLPKLYAELENLLAPHALSLPKFCD